jgi:hypothetical protein
LVSCENSHEFISVNLKRYIFHEICEWVDIVVRIMEFYDFSSRKNSQDKGSRQLSLSWLLVLSHRPGLPPRLVTTPAAAAASNSQRIAQRLLEPGATGQAMESNDANF